jgi:hypothetical protein
MSEYQYVAFRAVDAPLNDKQLEFAERQSSHAEVTQWSFDVDYDYGSFRGDVDGLLRRGYDVYLDYSHYSTRKIKLRFPHGMPFPENVWSKFVDGEQLSVKKDAKGPGEILSLEPFHEGLDYENESDLEAYLDAAVRIRNQLMNGDLRALYLLWLCAADDDYKDPAQMIEPPVPHGIAEAKTYGGDLLLFFDLDPLLLVAAGTDVPSAPNIESEERKIATWVELLDTKRAKELLHCMLVGETAGEKARLLAEIRDAQVSNDWPTSDKQRSLQTLLEATEDLRTKENAKKARKAAAKAKRDQEKADRERADRMLQMVKDPDQWLKEAERLVDSKGTHNYKAAATILADLRDAIGGEKGNQIAYLHAAHLVKKHPTLSHLKGSLKKQGLLK